MEKSRSTKKTTKTVKREKKDKVIEVKDNVSFEDETKNKFYYSFGKRLTTNIVIFLTILVLFVICFVMSFSITSKEFITYKENSDIDYRIYLKDNKFYDKEYLGKGMAYVASLIDRIHIDYSYHFLVDKKSNIDIKYRVKAKIVVASQSNSNVFFEKEYDLSKEITDEIINDTKFDISKKDIVIDYNYYNDLANDFKSHYAVNTDSRLEVSLYVSEKNKENNSYDFNSNNKVTLIIPLSQQEVQISFDNKNVNNEKQLINNPKFIIKDMGLAIVSVLLFIMLMISLISLIKKLSIIFGNKKNEYDKYVNRLLRGYDRIIINVKTTPQMDNYNVIKVESFQELIDVRDNISQPINYYIVTKHQKCEFFVINKDNLYLYVVKASDLDGKNN